MDAGSTCQYSKVQWENSTVGHPNVDGQATPRGHPDDSGGLLRAAVLSTFPWLQAASRLPHRLAGGLPYVEWHSLVHQVLLSILRETIHDNRFIRLIENLLTAGYLEDWKFNATLSGTPQGGVVSPILSNIYLDRLDKWIESTLLPAYTRGTERKYNTTYTRANARVQKLRRIGQRKEALALRKQIRTLPTHDPTDPDYRRLRYVRYADDFLLGLAGPRFEAEEIKARLGEFLRD